MLGFLQEVSLCDLIEDKRVWIWNKSRCFWAKSYFLNLIDKLNALSFLPSYLIWRAKIATKVKIMYGLSLIEINTYDMV